MSEDGQLGENSIVGSPLEGSDAGPLSPGLSDTQETTARDTSKAMHSYASILSPTPGSQKSQPVRGRSPASTSQRPPTASASVQREMEDLKIKLRLMEKKRMEDREKLRLLEQVQADRDRFQGIIQKMQSKFQPQQQEIADLKKQLKEEGTKYESLEAQQAENDTVNEMATLDREMAEETAESYKLELDALRRKAEELELEVEVLREENHELGKEMSPEEKTSQGWLQMERSNERLREALMRLRDVTQEQEANLKDQIEELQQDLQDLNKLKEEYDNTKEELSQTDITVEELRQQLDTALGAEEMIEELTEKNMALNEKLDELRITIEDLESLKDLNDELEINHTETEKQLQEEIDYNENLLAEEARKVAVQDGTIQDLEYTVNRFRNLAKNMQTDLEEMRVSQQITETEANDLNNRSRAMMDLNMRLQVSASKAQIKAIDLELGKMQAQESSEHLTIVQLFLPESFHSHRDSVQALLRFRRIAFKANMMHLFVKERMQGPLPRGQEDELFAFCDVLAKLKWVSSTCDRFISNIQTCSLEAFRTLGAASYELEPVERAFNVWIDGLKKDDLKGEQCSTELQRSISLMGHLAEIHISETLEHYADDVYMRALMMQSYLENAATALSHIKSVAEDRLPAPQDDDGEEMANYDEYMRKVDSLISQARSAKIVSGKSIRHLEDMRSRSLTLEPSTLSTVENSQNATSELASAVRSAGVSILKVLVDETHTEPLQYNMLRSLANTSFSSLNIKLQGATNALQAFSNLTSSLTQTVELPSPAPPAPWKTIAQNIKASTADMLARETELGRLKDEVTEKNTTLAMREKMIDEMGVKVEVLERRVGESGGRREKVRELEASVEAAKVKEKDLQEKLDQLQHELRSLEAEREKWKSAPQIAPHTPQPGQVAVQSVASEASRRLIDALKAEIRALQSAVRFLRAASHAQTLSKAHAFLSMPIAPIEPQVPNTEAEAKDVLKEMLGLVSKSENQTVKLQPRDTANRLRWRPAKETSTWKVQKLKEDWEEWREWRNSVAARVSHAKRENARMQGVKARGALRDQSLASVQMRLPTKFDGDRHVTIVKADEWEQIERRLGLNND